MDFVSTGMASIGSMFEDTSSFMDMMPGMPDMSAYTPDMTYVMEMIDTTYFSHAGVYLMDSGHQVFLEYGYALLAIAVSMVLISGLWFAFRKQIVSMVDDIKMPNMGISYSVSELAAKMGMKKVESPMKKSVEPKAKTPTKSPAKKVTKSPAMKRGKSPASMKKAKK